MPRRFGKVILEQTEGQLRSQRFRPRDFRKLQDQPPTQPSPPAGASARSLPGT